MFVHLWLKSSEGDQGVQASSASSRSAIWIEEHQFKGQSRSYFYVCNFWQHWQDPKRWKFAKRVERKR